MAVANIFVISAHNTEHIAISDYVIQETIVSTDGNRSHLESVICT